MHDLDTIVRLNREAEERALSLAYGRAMIANDQTGLGPETRNALHARLRRLRAALLALAATVMGSACGPDRADGPDRSIVFPAPHDVRPSYRVTVLRDVAGAPLVIVQAKRP